jgi:hypothetical protein
MTAGEISTRPRVLDKQNDGIRLLLSGSTVSRARAELLFHTFQNDLPEK